MSLILGIGVLVWIGLPGPERSASADPLVAANVRESRAAQREMELRVFEKRVSEDPFSAGDYASLALLYLERARATGNYEDVVRSEQAARQSLKLREAHNGSTYLILAYALLDQHRFSEAADAAARLVMLDPQPAYRALLGETQMELGRYAAADSTFRSLEWAREDLAVAPRLARWEELSGRPDRARYLLHKARADAARRTDLSEEQLVVFHFRVGEFHLRNGYLKDAEKDFEAGLAVRPGDYRIIAQQAKLAALRHRWEDAIELGNLATEKALEPGTLGLISDSYEALGDRTQAAEYARAMEIAVRGQQRAFHREWSHFLLDHDLQVQMVYDMAVRDLEERDDIYGYDLLAWALYKQGKYPEASAAMTKAQKLGTKDAALHFHAGMIDIAVGNHSRGEKHLRYALKLNKRWHHSQPARARAVLDSLGQL